MAPRKPASVNIKDVARHAGVSLGSASRVVNNVPNVGEATRAKVLAAIEALGYRPNHAAQSLRSRSTRTIGCLVTDVSNPLYAQLFRALEERFLAEGYLLLLANGLNDPDREIALLNLFRLRGMDGVVIAPGNERHAGVLKAVAALEMPAVVLDRDLASPHDKVQFDHAAGMRAAVARLAGLGHRRIALVQSQSANRPMRRRAEGLRAACKAHGLEFDDRWLVQLPSSTSSAYDAVAALLATPDRPTALLVQGTSILVETLNAIAAAGLSLPRDLSLVTLGDPDFAVHHAPPLTALRVDLHAVADRTAERLLARLGGETAEAVSLRVPSELIERGSCGPAP